MSTVEVDPQVEQFQLALEQKQNEIDSLREHVGTLAAFKAEALNGRDTIQALEAKAVDMERQVVAARMAGSEAASAAASAASSASNVKVEAAEQLPKSLRVLLGQ